MLGEQTDLTEQQRRNQVRILCEQHDVPDTLKLHLIRHTFKPPDSVDAIDRQYTVEEAEAACLAWASEQYWQSPDGLWTWGEKE